ncbi:hypothetical protein TRFO_03551 [Tritrichomonas foetus]|uniref:E2F/DP family winged-helix DNA-binding domain-containing protein n=1 Tax=Tritrichomonas foetus TaxID=1144522 RepID=A0A1J4KMM4_9EUKA|nr:hypothetical protein TRFO_03551 [Tritrichomonas foetus]|eukprot:OHT12553.1 hypothetical protein TRFO_03551 [Tritrichomonas foetus]
MFSHNMSDMKFISNFQTELVFMASEKQTLVNLTQGFLKILTDANGNDVELSHCERQLKTTKRRLYDVINVLSGVGLVERSGKSKVHWTGNQTTPTTTTNEKPMSDQEKELDRLLEKADAELLDLSESELFKKCAWITRDDFSKLTPDPDTTLFALCGPPNLTITMKDDDEEPMPHHLICRVENGEGEITLSTLTANTNIPQPLI